MNSMSAVIFKAHFDGEHIQLDEPHSLEPGCQLLVTVFAPELEAQRRDFFNAAIHSFARAYGDDEPEYTEADCIKE